MGTRSKWLMMVIFAVLCGIRNGHAQVDTLHVSTDEKSTLVRYWLPEFGRDSVGELKVVMFVPMQLVKFSVNFLGDKQHLEKIELKTGSGAVIPYLNCSTKKKDIRHTLACLEVKLDDYFGDYVSIKYLKRHGDRIRTVDIFFKYYDTKLQTQCTYFVDLEIYLD